MVALWLLLVACGGGDSPVAPPQPPPVAEPAPPIDRPSTRALPTSPLTDEERTAYMRCDTDSECIGIDIDCCTLCNGGTAMPVRRDSAQLALDKLKPKDCSSVSCTELACDIPPVGCVDGRCQFKVGGPPPGMVSEPTPLLPPG